METKNSRNLSMKKITGQGMSEYLVIVGLLAVAGIAAMGFMGGSIRSTMAGFASEMAGDSGQRDASITSAKSDAKSSDDNSTAGLDDYGTNNDKL